MRAQAIVGFLIVAVASAAASVAAGMSRTPSASAANLKEHLTPEQFEVTQEEGTEPPFHNAFWNNHAAGIYVDVVSGEPLFSSRDKFESGTGWPSFTRPLVDGNIQTRTDGSLAMQRTEVRSRHGNSHLGHVFDDGPQPTGLRYCINSAALRFIPAEKLVDEGYPQFAKDFGIDTSKRAVATLGGGCFWGMQEIIRKIPGVISSEVGYAGGSMPFPSYEDVSSGQTGHAESVKIVFDPSKLSYEQLLGYFFRMHDPTTLNRQHNDVGSQYRSVIFVYSDEQRRAAEAVKAKVDAAHKWPGPIVTEIAAAGPFWEAEDYHQDYLVKHPDGYTCHVLRPE